MIKLNDWVVANLNNPDFSVDNFQNDLGMNLENTLLLPKDEYKKSLLIKDTFKLNDGSFDEKTFDAYYNSLATKFNDFAVNNNLDNYEYSLWDTNNRNLGKTRDPKFQFIQVPNPDRVSTGIMGRNVVGPRTMSASELAQTLRIFDPETGLFLDKTPNDATLFSHPIDYIKSLFDDPLVIATWDEAGEHIDPITGKQVHHEKGDKKLNDEGTYYAEKLNGRSLIGKLVISAFDTLTVDGSEGNKYDFFDSDGLDKDPAGTISKNLLAIAPLAFLGPVGSAIYGGMFVVREMAKALPMLYGMAAIFSDDVLDNKLLNTLAGYGAKFTSGVSEYSLENAFTFENFGNLVSDIALLWGLQKAIALSLLKLSGTEKLAQNALLRAMADYENKVRGAYIASVRGQISDAKALTLAGLTEFSPLAIEGAITSGKWLESPLGKRCLEMSMKGVEKAIESRTRLGLDLSLAYMAIISNTDVYESALEHGATKKEAAWLALGTTAGMFAVDKYTGLGELFWDDEKASARKIYRASLKDEAGKAVDLLTKGEKAIGAIINKESKEKTNERFLKRWLRKGMETSSKFINDYFEGVKDHTLGLMGKAVGEGLEEVSEELVTDFGKLLFEIAGDLGYVSLKDFGAWDDWLSRYAMSLFGGALGGGIFHEVDAFRNRGSLDEKKIKKELAYLIANGKKDEILALLDKLRKKGLLGDTNLSVHTEKSDDGTKNVFVTADNKHISLNDYIYNILKASINQLDNIINENRMNLTDALLFDKMVLGDMRYLGLRDYLQDASYVTGYLEKFRDLTLAIYDNELNLKLAANTIDGTLEGIIVRDGYLRNQVELATYDANIKALRDLQLALYEERDKFLNGEYSALYVEKMLFAIDTGLNNPFMSMTFGLWVRNNKHKSYDELTSAEKTEYGLQWQNYIDSAKKHDLDTAFGLYKAMQKLLTPVLETLRDSEVTLWKFSIEAIERSFPTALYANWDTKLRGETDEAYNLRNTKLETETDELFEARKLIRTLQIVNLNKEDLLKFVNTFANTNGFIDSSTYRSFVNWLTNRKIDYKRKALGDVVKNLVSAHNTLVSTSTTPVTNEFIRALQTEGVNEAITNTLMKLKDDASNEDDILEEVTNIIKDNTVKFLYLNYTSGLSILTFTKVVVFNDPSTRATVKNSDYFTLFENIIGNTVDENSLSLIHESLKNKLRNDLLTYAPNLIEDINFEILAGEGTPEEALDVAVDEFYSSKDIEKLFSSYIKYKNLLNKLLVATDPVLIDRLEKDITLLKEDIAIWDDLDIEPEKDRLVKNAESKAKELVKNTALAIKTSEWIKAINSVLTKVNTDANPVLTVLKAVATLLGTERIDIESLLARVEQEYQNIDTVLDFRLSPDEEKLLQLARELLDFAKAFVYGAATESSYSNPMGHNKAINEFNRNHKLKLRTALGTEITVNPDELVEIDLDKANIYIHEFERYLKEIDAWIDKSYRNLMDKIKKFKDADAAFIKTRLDLFSTLRNYFTTNSGVDLLEGYETLNLTLDALSIHKVEELLYSNVLKLIKKLKDLGKDSNAIYLEIFSIFNSGIVNLGKLELLLVSDLDDRITYDSLTDYDKWSYIVGTMTMKSSDFYKQLKDFIEKDNPNNPIAPLSLQEYDARMSILLLHNPEMINAALSWVSERIEHTLPILYNTTVVTGLGGAGKTAVVAKMSANHNSEDIWLGGPTEDLTTNLLNSLLKGILKTKDTMMSEILGSDIWSLVLGEYDKPSKLLLLHSRKGIDGNNVITISDELKAHISKPTKAPKLIIIDEATHYSIAELQIISEFARLNNINVLLLGDENLNGFYNDKSFMLNLDRETSLAWRTPRLNISLRDSNTLKNGNLALIVNILDKLRKSSDISASARKTFLELIKDISLGYYELMLYGDQVIDSLTLLDVEKINNALKELEKTTGKKGIIGFISTTESGPTLDILKLFSEYEVKVFTPDAVLGLEFDYAIIDKTWDLDLANYSVASMLSFLQDLYTMVSRSRHGSLIINNGLTNIIKPSNKLPYTGNPAETIKLAAVEFLTSKLATIEEILKNTKEDLPEVTVEPTPQNNLPISKATLLNKIKAAANLEELNNLLSSANTVEAGLAEDPDIKAAYALRQIELTPKSSKPEIDETAFGEDPEPTDNKDSRDEALTESKTLELDFATIDNVPIRVYGNLHLIGVNNETKELDGKKITKWINNGNKRDVGCFMEDGEETTNASRKHELMTHLLKTKSLIEFGITEEMYNLLPKVVKDKFSLEAFLNAEYYVEVVEDSEENKSKGYTLGGMTTLKNEKLGVRGKIISLVAKIDGRDLLLYTITMGGLANPDTWAKNKEKITGAINKRIGLLRSSLTGDSEADNLANLTIEELTKYVNNLGTYITSYSDAIDRMAPGTLLEIDTPEFGGMTTLVPYTVSDPRDPENEIRKSIRLEELDNSNSTWDLLTRYAVVSPVMIYGAHSTTDPERVPPGIDPSVKGKPVIFVSSNLLLSPTELEKLYRDLRIAMELGKPVRLDVRMIVLNNEGVSFKSLFDVDYKELYKTLGKNGLYDYYPAELEPLGLRMYIAMWNYRCNLTKFNNLVNEFEGLGHNVTALIEQDNKAYTLMHEKYKDSDEYLSESEYRRHLLEDNPSVASLLKPLWDFNDSLAHSVRLFRLGTNSKYGAYIRTLTNLVDGEFYSTTETPGKIKVNDISKVLGIYMHPSIARLLLAFLDKLFELVIDKVVPREDPNFNSWVDPKMAPGWYNKVDPNTQNHILELTVGDDPSSVVTFKMPGSEGIKRLPVLLSLLAKLLEIRLHKVTAFDEAANEEGLTYINSIKVDGEYIDVSLFGKTLDGDLLSDTVHFIKNKDGELESVENVPTSNWDPENILGVEVLKDENGNIQRVFDRRIDDLFSLMFHGATWSFVGNDFSNSKIRATEARFKYGILTDPKLKAKSGEGLVSTNRKFLSTDVIPGHTIMSISLKTKVYEVQPAKPKVENEETTQTLDLTDVVNAGNTLLKLLKPLAPELIAGKDKDWVINKLIHNKIDEFEAFLQDAVTGKTYIGKDIIVNAKWLVDHFEPTTLEDVAKTYNLTNILCEFDNDGFLVVYEHDNPDHKYKVSYENELIELISLSGGETLPTAVTVGTMLERVYKINNTSYGEDVDGVLNDVCDILRSYIQNSQGEEDSTDTILDEEEIRIRINNAQEEITNLIGLDAEDESGLWEAINLLKQLMCVI